MTRAAAESAEGAIILPKRASFWAAGALLMGLAGQLVWAGSDVAKIEARFEDLDRSDVRLIKRSDERYGMIVSRIEALERDRSTSSERLIRLAEQVKLSVDLLREIRESMRAPPRR